MIVSRPASSLRPIPEPRGNPTAKPAAANEFAKLWLGSLRQPSHGKAPDAAAVRQSAALRRESVPSQSQTAQNSLPSDIGNPERWDELFDFFASSQAYWARQPEEVRKLREIPDPWARRDYGIELAHRGFQIDPAIMIWGWDPLRTMLLRRYYGYSWVPAALQPPVLVAPGRQVPDGPSYDPLRPPPGAILVDISFAVVRSSPQIPASVSSTVGRRPQLLDRYL